MKKLVNLLFFLIVLSIISGYSQVERIEPPGWWAGMNSEELELIVYGKNIASCSVGIEYPGIRIKSVSRQENPNYLFIDLEIQKDIKPGQFRIKFLKDGRIITEEPYVLEERKENSAERDGFDNSDVIYLLMPDRFVNGDPSNDVIPGMLENKINRKDPYGRHGGDIRGITEHLDYIEEMGFTALWLNPVLENNQKEQSYHGYAITDFYKVDPRFGTNEDFRELTRKASERGIKMIMDMVFNHCGSEHWWMKDLPSPDWINMYPDYVYSNHRKSLNQDPYRSESDLRDLTDGWFVATMPDLNQRNPFMARYLIQNSIWWIEYLGLAGIRMDTYPYPDKFMMSAWCKRILEEYPDFNIVGEEWNTNPLTVSYWQKGQVNRDGYQGNLPSVFDFPLQNAVTRGLLEEPGWSEGMIRIYDAISNDFIYPDPYNLVIFPDNHDMSRFYMQVGMDEQLYKLGIAFYLTTRGIPQFLYGSEILMTHTEGNDHGNIRKDFPGGWEKDPQNGFTGLNMDKKSLEMQDFFKDLLNWRNENPVIHTGKLMHFVPKEEVYVYFRYNDQKKVMVILNKNKSQVTLDPSRFSEVTENCITGKDVISGLEFDLTGKLKLEPMTPYILELK